MAEHMLPAPFADLERLADWGLPTERERHDRRLTSTMGALRDYYSTLLPRMEAMVEHLNGFDLATMPVREKRLLYMGLMFIEAAVAVEMFKDPDIPDGLPAEQMEILSESLEQELIAGGLAA
ncbi:MAG: hypothetical protein VX663_08510 [Pseudomonadota bacterium]|nr:hypothetical protein [Pseudomonadota bacterium]